MPRTLLILLASFMVCTGVAGCGGGGDDGGDEYSEEIRPKPAKKRLPPGAMASGSGKASAGSEGDSADAEDE